MPEAYQRSSDISHLGLGNSDLEQRGVVVAGYSPGELLPPYDTEAHQLRAEKILNHTAQSTKVLRLRTAGDSFDIPVRQQFPDTKIIEVVGGYVEFCVLFAVASITENGLFALVSSQLVLGAKTHYSDFTLGRMVLGSQKEIQNAYQIIAKETFLIYKPSK